jgi:WD40 repeat protein
MACKFIEICPGQDLFIGGYQQLMQWSVSQNKVTKEYSGIMTSSIVSMV